MVKLGATLFKYVPQAYLNYTRKSTVGWAVGNVLLDFSGGVLSLAQTLLNGYRFGWTGVYANPIKFALGFVSIAYDVFFLFQHYVLYPLREEAKDHEEPLVMVPEETDAAGDDEEDALPERKLV